MRVKLACAVILLISNPLIASATLEKLEPNKINISRYCALSAGFVGGAFNDASYLVSRHAAGMSTSEDLGTGRVGKQLGVTPEQYKSFVIHTIEDRSAMNAVILYGNQAIAQISAAYENDCHKDPATYIVNYDRFFKRHPNTKDFEDYKNSRVKLYGW